MSQNHLMTVQTWEMTLITPLHVGDGGSHLLNQDYVSNGRNIDVLDLDDILESLEDNPSAIGEMGQGQFNLARFIRDYKINVTPRYVFSNVSATPNDIRRFLKNAHGQAYVPGSSLKGAMRTALLQLSPENFQNCRDYYDLSRQVKNYKSRDPHHDFLRPLHVSDSEGLAPRENLNLSEIKFFNLQAADTPGWKDFSSRRTGQEFRQATGLFVETLKPAAKVHVQVGLDEFLLSETGNKAAKLPKDNALKDFKAIANVLNRHAFTQATAEKSFFARYGTHTAAVTAFYKDLLAMITKADGDGFYLRMAWGSGWRGMTGNWMDDEMVRKVRKFRRLGKMTRQGEMFPVFPKSRRLAMHDGIPALPLGWIHVRPAEKSLFWSIAGASLAENTPQSQDAPTTLDNTQAPPAQNPVTAPPVDPETARQGEVEAFRGSLPKRNMLPGEMDKLIEAIKRKTDEETRKRCCEALLRFAETDGKGFKKAKNGGKPWAVKLTTLCEELGVM